MENLSEPDAALAIPVAIPVPAYLRDHHVSGRVVLPAVEALQILAATLPPTAGADPLLQGQGQFGHLLTVEPGLREIPVIHEWSRDSAGRSYSRLVTVLSGKQARWTRRIEHGSVVFSSPGTEGDLAPEPLPEGKAKAGEVFTVPRRRLYDELVPFGPAYQNVAGEVLLTPAGASAEISGGGFPEAAGPLGSPFPADAAFHVACAWGQRYKNTIAFPVAFEERRIFRPTAAGETYACRVVPLPGEGPVLRFDIWLYGRDKEPAELFRGLQMRDISGGRRKPPAWIREGT
ncbi:MAG: polyketide synthase dehydratase domain-containing protein [Deltaproteobacteria bacterium]|nr:polyketide synthase dehydratase domain-containing protein [Deltaproteobacteria bacterium]